MSLHLTHIHTQYTQNYPLIIQYLKNTLMVYKTVSVVYIGTCETSFHLSFPLCVSIILFHAIHILQSVFSESMTLRDEGEGKTYLSPPIH